MTRRNVEIKARVTDLDAVRRRVAPLAALGIDPGARIAAAYVDLLASPASVYSPANEPA